MTIPQLIEFIDTHNGHLITVNGMLHSDAEISWLNEKSMTEEAQIVLQDSRIASLLLDAFPPCLGGSIAYCLKAILRGVVKYDHELGSITLNRIESVIVERNGVSHQLL